MEAKLIALCKCGHARDLHHHDHSCTGIEDIGKLRYCKCEQFRGVQTQVVEQGDEMAKKKKSAVKRHRGEFLYEAFSSKIEASKYNKKVNDKESKSHLPAVLAALLKFEKPVTLDRLVTAIKDSGRYKSTDAARWIRVDLAILAGEGLIKATKIEAGSKANGAPKSKRVRKPRAARSKSIETTTQAAEAIA